MSPINTHLPARLTNKLIDDAFWPLQRACQSHLGRELQDLLDLNAREERAHRRLGARFTNGQVSYRVSAPQTARYFAVRDVMTANPQATVSDMDGLREGVIKAHMLRSKMDKHVYMGGDETIHGKTLWEAFRIFYQQRIISKVPAQYLSLASDHAFVYTPMWVWELSARILGCSVEAATVGHMSYAIFGIDYARDIAVH